MSTASIAAAKQSLRSDLRKRLKGLSSEYIQSHSERICKALLSSDVYKQAAHVALYLSMPVEVATDAIIQDIFASGKTCYVPRYDTSTMDMLRVYGPDDLSSLDKTSLNISQPDLQVSAAIVRAAATEGRHAPRHDRHTLESAPHQGLVPRENPLETGRLDLIIVPGLGFTTAGDRIGRGKGYYDKFLHRMHDAFSSNGWKMPATVALTFPVQIVDSIPTDERDVKVDAVIH